MSLGVYVVVSDLEASTAFYSALFRTDPYIVTPEFVGFRVSGSVFAIFLESAFEHEVVRGTNTLPYIRVDDVEAEHQRLREMGAELHHEQVVVEPAIRFFVAADPDGNLLELYSLNAPVG